MSLVQTREMYRINISPGKEKKMQLLLHFQIEMDYGETFFLKLQEKL